METKIQFGIRYLAHGDILDYPSETKTYQIMESLMRLQIPAEIMCRRVTYGAWKKPSTRVLGGSYSESVGERG
jgi:hypothetical protein